MASDQELILRLLECDVLKIGTFKLRSGDISPIYVDLRRIIHYPQVVKLLVRAIRERQIKENLETDTVCGVPYTSIPIASVFSAFYDVPMVMKRKETKDYGTKRLVEGHFKKGDSCLLIEDIMCSGTSIMETSLALRKEGLNVHHCIVIINRDQGGIENLKKVELTAFPLFHINSVFNVFCSVNRIEAEIAEKITSYFKNNSHLPIFRDETYPTLSFSRKAEITNHPTAKRLLEIMNEKKTNLCVAVDTNNCQELKKLAEQLGPHICILKTHIDILNDFSEDLIEELRKLSRVYNFLIMEDRKFADIGNTVMQQYRNGMYKIETWADLVTVHGVSGKGTIEALKSSSNDKNACILIAEMSTDGALMNDDYKKGIFQIANNHTDFVIGYVAQNAHPEGKNLICMCPGINISSKKDSLNQIYKSPEDAVLDGADIIIVGRGIYQAEDAVASAIEYKTRSFNAYLNRIS